MNTSGRSSPSFFAKLGALAVGSLASASGVLVGLLDARSAPAGIPPLPHEPRQADTDDPAILSSVSALASGRPCRVLEVAARFLPELGGIETHVNEVTRRMARRGDLDLTVLATDRSGKLSSQEQFEGFSVLRCRAYPSVRDYYFAPALRTYISAGQYDLIHCQGIHTAVPVLAMAAARSARIPYIVTLHTGGHSSRLRNSLRKIQWQCLAPLLRNAAVVIAVSDYERRLFQETCRIKSERFRVVRNGGDFTTQRPSVAPVPGRIVSCGRLERYKGHHRVIQALPIVRQLVPEARLHIIGSGSYERQLRSLISALDLDEFVTIEYIPPTERSRMAEALCAASVLAAFSDYEAHPVAVMEALALGVPVVGVDAAGIGEMVAANLVRGVPPDADIRSIADTLTASLRHRAVQASPQLPSWDSAADTLASIYLETVTSASRAAP